MLSPILPASLTLSKLRENLYGDMQCFISGPTNCYVCIESLVRFCKARSQLSIFMMYIAGRLF